jgi:hypothetical protein
MVSSIQFFGQNIYIFLILHFTFLFYLLTLNFSEEHKLCSSILCNFLPFPVTLSLAGPIIFISITTHCIERDILNIRKIAGKNMEIKLWLVEGCQQLLVKTEENYIMYL